MSPSRNRWQGKSPGPESAVMHRAITTAMSCSPASTRLGSRCCCQGRHNANTVVQSAAYTRELLSECASIFIVSAGARAHT